MIQAITQAKQLIARVNHRIQFYNLQLHKFEPKVQISFETHRYKVRTVDSPSELERILRFRFDIFFREGLNVQKSSGIDADDFDLMCDHLYIEDKQTGLIVGTYRLLSSLTTDKFYSHQEFEIQDFLATPGIKLELGRACVHPKFRTGLAVNLLWRGIGEYVRVLKPDLLFGCASVKPGSLDEMKGIYQYLSTLYCNSNVSASPTSKFHGNFDFKTLGKLELDTVDLRSIRQTLPPLLKSYLNAGAKIAGEPAWDEDFHCYDLFLTLKISEMTDLFQRKFIGGDPAFE